jgi:D-galactarolactone isomerase
MAVARLQAPPGTCDTHMHFYDARFPTAPTALSTQPDATPSDYRKLQAKLGLQRVVVVQPTAYGADNRCTMEGVAAIGANARAVVVVERDAPDAELKRLAAAGARGLRFFRLGGAYYDWPDLERMAKRAADHGWHLQLQLDGTTLDQYEARLLKLPCDLVIDHVGRFHQDVGLDHPGMKTLLKLMGTGRCWVKLSAPYENKTAGPPRYQDVGVRARALVKAKPESCVWASNWPHPNHSPKPDDAMLLDLLLDWADDDTTRRRILVDNPARLYGFA